MSRHAYRFDRAGAVACGVPPPSESAKWVAVSNGFASDDLRARIAAAWNAKLVDVVRDDAGIQLVTGRADAPV